MLRTLSLFSIGLLVSACGDNISDAKRIVEDNLGIRKPDFRTLTEFPGGVVCGEYVVKTADFSTALEQQPFITVRGKLYQPPSRQQWEFFCGGAPTETLFKKTGIGPYGPGNPELARITADLTELGNAMESYYSNHFAYPTMAQGLQALVTPPSTLESSEKYPSGGYLNAVPADPWGRPYLYMEEQWGRTKGSFAITTLGADGVEGGTGKNADINTGQLEYLQHLAELAR